MISHVHPVDNGIHVYNLEIDDYLITIYIDEYNMEVTDYDITDLCD